MKKSPVAYSDKRIKRITLMPGFLLKIKGKLDSGKGETIPNAYIHKMLSCCAGIENSEVIHAESMLEKERKAAASAITNIAQKKRKLCGIPGEVSEDSDSPFVVRENNRNKKAKQEILADINHCYEELSIIQEQLIGGHTVLDERVEKTRNLGMRSVNKYIEGVRSGKLPEYDPEITFFDNARFLYLNRHEEGDRKIRDYVAEYRDKNAKEENV